jgi:hypothetical protein
MGGYLVGDYQSQDFSTVDDVVVVSLGSGRCFACSGWRSDDDLEDTENGIFLASCSH